MAEKFEFGSGQWLDLASEVLADAVHEARASIAGESLSVCEVFTDPPEHLRANGADEIAWGFVIENGTSRVVRGSMEDANYSLRHDYRATLPGARAILGTTPEEIEERLNARRQAVQTGALNQKGSLDSISPAMRMVLIELHNRLARQTA